MGRDQVQSGQGSRWAEGLSWLAAGKRPEWADVAALDMETRAYHSQWASLEAQDGILYLRWRAPGRGADLLQLLCLSKQQSAHSSMDDPISPAAPEADGAVLLSPASQDNTSPPGSAHPGPEARSPEKTLVFCAQERCATLRRTELTELFSSLQGRPRHTGAVFKGKHQNGVTDL
ncbi:hypothetical protein AAFF_G00081940 [Aldrovandia affinis]|uniref:Uncharacterized protein n=1 Tax=Aldrovandia affinis TaxID=143900 RepID=A0AAD7T3F7_9TELE|nr:hypothetical protein AAFF_G00081940 [Aldrovandia affinis]